ALELFDSRGDENRHRTGYLVLHTEGALGLELEERDSAVLRDAIELGAEGPIAVSRDVLDPLEERARCDARRAVLVREDPVLPPVLLASPARSRRRGDGRLDRRNTRGKLLDQRPLTGARWARYDDHRRHGLSD